MIYNHGQEDDNLGTDLVNDLPTNLTVNAISYVKLDSSDDKHIKELANDASEIQY